MSRSRFTCALTGALTVVAVAATPARATDPPPPPNCPLDPPQGLICVPGPKASYKFVGAAATTDPKTECTVTLENAAPPDQNGTGRVQFRTSNVCDRIIRVVTIDTKLVRDATQTTVATGPQAHCHVLSTDPNCGLSTLVSGADVTGLDFGSYTQVATVRLVLQEAGAPDPWVVTPVTPGADPASCTGGDFEVICDLRLGVVVDDPDAGFGGTPATRMIDSRINCFYATVMNLPQGTVCAT